MAKFIGYLDEFSKRPKPWHRISTYGVVDALGDLSGVRELFDRFGVVKVRRMLEPPARDKLMALIQETSGLADADYKRVYNQEVKPFSGGNPATTDSRYWPIILHPTVRMIARNVFREARCTEIGTSVGAHYSARGLHRDFPNLYDRTQGPDNMYDGPHSILRMLHYVNAGGRPAGAFGWVPFSHKKKLYEEQAPRVGITRPLEWFENHHEVVRNAFQKGDAEAYEEMEAYQAWVHMDPGDAILLDARILHGGDYVQGPRYFLVTTFIRENEKTRVAVKRRWAKGVGPVEVEYLQYLHENGFCSASLLNELKTMKDKNITATLSPKAGGGMEPMGMGGMDDAMGGAKPAVAAMPGPANDAKSSGDKPNLENLAAP